MIITKMHLSRRTMLRGLGAALALPLLDSMVPALTALANDRGGAGPAARRVLRAQRHVDAVLVPEGGRAARRAAGDAAVARRRSRTASCCAAASPTKPANLVKGGGDHARSAGTFLTGVPFKITVGRRRPRLGVDGSDRGAGVRQGNAARLARARHRVERDARRRATAARAAPTRTPSRGARRRRRCRSRTIRARCSSGCSARAAAPIAAARLARIKRDRSILDFVSERGRQPRAASSARSDKVEDRPSISIRCATSSGASRWPRSRTRASCRSSISRSASRATTPSTPS